MKLGNGDNDDADDGEDDDGDDDGEDGENKALLQDNPKHGESAGQTECCGELPTFNT